MHKGPTPADLWRATHEVPRAPKEKTVRSDEAWRDLVGRLNESSKKRETVLLKAQHKQLADQLAATQVVAVSAHPGVIATNLARHIAMQQSAGGHHLGVEQGMARQQTVEIPAMPVGPVHHGGDA
jgi:hypothetical protein